METGNTIPIVCVCEKRARLERTSDGQALRCSDSDCIHSKEGQHFDIHNEIPVIISNVLCDTVCGLQAGSTYVDRPMTKFGKFRKVIQGENKVTKENINTFVSALFANVQRPRVLVIGSGERGSGTDELWNNGSLEIHGVDVYSSDSVDVVCDAHYLPLESNYYDGVVIQAVLEHVVEPAVVVQEIYRVLKVGGFVYAETPFMQQVHEGAYDFTRYTVLGHRYLFRDFETIKMGGVGGAAIALQWSIKYFIWALTRVRRISQVVGTVLGIVLRPLDGLLSEKSLFDAPSGVYFLGRKVEGIRISHKELVLLYKGNI